MKILQCVNVMSRGGIETFLMNVLREIDRYHYQFTFACVSQKRGDYDDEIVKLGGKIIYMPPLRFSNPKLLIDGLKARKKFFMVNNDFDVCHIHASTALSAYFRAKYALQAGIKQVIVHAHNTGGVNAVINKIFSNKLNHLHILKAACSASAGEWLFGKKAVRQHEVKIIYNGINTAMYNFDPSIAKRYRHEFNAEDKIIVGHIGRFARQKNHDFLIDVFSDFANKHTNAELWLIGCGELEAEIKAKVERLELMDKVKFLGVRSDVPQLLMAMDVFVFPSIFEGLGIVLVEAQLASLPTVTTLSIPPEAIISNAVAQLDNFDVTKWENAIEVALLQKRDDIEYCGRESYDISNVVKGLESLYSASEEGKNDAN